MYPDVIDSIAFDLIEGEHSVYDFKISDAAVDDLFVTIAIFDIGSFNSKYFVGEVIFQVNRIDRNPIFKLIMGNNFQIQDADGLCQDIPLVDTDTKYSTDVTPSAWFIADYSSVYLSQEYSELSQRNDPMSKYFSSRQEKIRSGSSFYSFTK